MKYIEELSPGDCFELSNKYYLLSKDFKKDGKKLCLSLIDGFSNWFSQETIVNQIDLFIMDKENNIIAIKERKKTHVSD